MRSYSGVTAVVLDVLGGVVAGLIFSTISIVIGFIGGVLVFLVLIAMSVRIISQWNRMPVLRLGSYKGIIGPGFVLIIPFIEKTPILIDLRVINTSFSAEQTLTKDNVPVNVEAILFWQVADPEKATLNVQSYYNSVQLAAQTALRDIIGRNTLSDMLAGRNTIGNDIDSVIQERVGDWGIKATSVEIKDVKIPQDLQDAMAKVATAEREKMARVALAESESLAADKMLDAAKKYESDPYAMQLRSLNMMYEISMNSASNQIVFIPTESKGFSLPTPIGVLGVEKIGQGAPQAAPAKKQKKAETDNEQ